MREIRQSGSEGGGSRTQSVLPTPIGCGRTTTGEHGQFTSARREPRPPKGDSSGPPSTGSMRMPQGHSWLSGYQPTEWLSDGEMCAALQVCVGHRAAGQECPGYGASLITDYSCWLFYRLMTG